MNQPEIIDPPAGAGNDGAGLEDLNADAMPAKPNYDVSFAVLLEVRDHAMFLAKLPELMKKLPVDDKEITWKEDFYAGITVRRSGGRY